jgi:GTP-binding protein
VHQGSLKTNSDIVVRSLDGSVVEKSRVTKILAFRGLKRDAIDVAQAGDIVAIAGTLKGTVTHTLSASDADIVLPATPIDPPTLSMTFSVNDSPLAGREGSKLTSRVIWDRLMKEVESNVALKVAHTDDQEAFEVSGRGELHLGILIENMRREGFELSISRPRVVYKTDEQGQKLEPFEEVTVDVDDAYTGVVVEKLTLRKGSMVAMNPSQGGKTRLVLHVPARGLIGYHNEFLTDTRGTGLMNKSFLDYRPYAGDIGGRIPGVLISTEQGDAVAYGLFNLEDRGIMFVEGGTAVYEGMIIGEHTRNNDLCVNPLKSKQLTNVRASGKDDAVKLTPPQKFTLEQALAYIEDDELVEVTPKSVRLRKRYLDPNERKRRSRQKDS